VDTEQLCSLLRSADERYSTLSCEFAVRFYPGIAAKAERRQVEIGKVKLVGISDEQAFGDWDALDGEVTEHRVLVRVKRPDCYREQDFDEDEPTLLVRDGTRWPLDLASQVPSGGTADGAQPTTMGRYEMCVRPEALPERLNLEVAGAGKRVGREVICANGRRLPPRPQVNGTTRMVAVNLSSWFSLPVFSNGGDDYTVEIDAATGVILRIASVFENQDWMVIEAVDAEFDEPLPENTFTVPEGLPAEKEGTKRSRWFGSRQ
jgi:hypothetical protein